MKTRMNCLWWRYVTRLTWMQCVVLLFVATQDGHGVSYGGWECRSSGKIVSRGTFIQPYFGPFVSPRAVLAADQPAACADKYYRDLVCDYEFRAPSDHLVYVEFITIELDESCDADFIEMDLLHGRRRVCGQSGFHETYDIADGNRMTVSLRTDRDFHCQGFAAFFTSFRRPGRRRRNAHRGNYSDDEAPDLIRARRESSHHLVRRGSNEGSDDDYSSSDLNDMMRKYRRQQSWHLNQCRQSVMNTVWQNSPCSICNCPELANCECHGPQSKRKRRAIPTRDRDRRSQDIKRSDEQGHHLQMTLPATESKASWPGAIDPLLRWRRKRATTEESCACRRT